MNTWMKTGEDKDKGIRGLQPSQYKTLLVLENASGPLSERQVRERRNRKNPVYFELNALLKFGLIIREKKKNIYFYSLKKEA